MTVFHFPIHLISSRVILYRVLGLSSGTRYTRVSHFSLVCFYTIYVYMYIYAHYNFKLNSQSNLYDNTCLYLNDFQLQAQFLYRNSYYDVPHKQRRLLRRKKNIGRRVDKTRPGQSRSPARSRPLVRVSLLVKS